MMRVRHGNRQALSYKYVAPGRPESEMVVIEKDGVWYVSSGTVRFKARPYEALPLLPAFYGYMKMSDLSFITNATQLAGRPFDSKNGRILSYYEPATDPSRTLAVKLREIVVERRKLDLPPHLLAELETMQKSVDDFLDKGELFQVDENTGLIVAAHMNDYPDVIANFQWLSDVPEDDLTPVSGAVWEDRTRPWSAAELEDSILTGYRPFLPDDTRNPEVSLCLLNLTSGEMRRIPYSGLSGLKGPHGCFLQGNREMVFTSHDSQARMQLERIDLATGGRVAVNAPSLDTLGFFCMERSPAGDKIAAAAFRASDGSFAFQIATINVADGAVTVPNASESFDKSVSWLPDGDGLVVVRLKAAAYPGGSKPSVICRMDLKGNVTELFEGDSPLVLRKARRMLYRDKNTRLWQICDLDGNNSQLYGDGFDGHFMPVVSPDDTKVVFLRERFGKPPQPYLFTVGKTSGTRITRIEGVFSEPVWR